MQFSNLVGQYTNTTGTVAPASTKMGVDRLVAKLSDMKTGNIFEGTVNYSKNGKALIALSNGQTLSARLDSSVSLTQGQSMFFQVKSNDGTTIAIRPYTVEGAPVNLTLMNALSAANLPFESSLLNMVNAMMENGMPIDRDSLNQMARLVSNNPTANVETLVQMQNLKLPITPEMISQFENYANDKQAITNELNQFMDNLPEALANQDLNSSQLLSLGSQVLDILSEGLLAQAPGILFTEIAAAEDIAGGEQTVAEDQVQMEQGQIDQAQMDQTQTDKPQIEDEALAQPGSNQAGHAVLSGTISMLSAAADTELAGSAVGQIMDSQELSDFSKLLSDLKLMPEGLALNEKSDSVALLKELAKVMVKADGQDQAPVLKLLQSNGFQTLMKNAMQMQWTLKPEQLTGERDQISKLYDHLKDQLDRIETAVKATGQEASSLTSTASEIRANVDFMQQINQTYQYVQIPLQMNGQTASGELYVYTNKKNLQEDNGELSAFLHLDMDNLGSTDVSVKLRDKNVDTKFYFDNDASYDLIKEHYGELVARLQKKGFHCKVEVVNEKKQVNFVDDFMKMDKTPTSLVHRYSFDMRA